MKYAAWCLLLAGCAPVPPRAETEWFPLAAGTEWLYRDQERAEQKATVVDSLTAGGATWTRIDELASAWYAMTPGGLYCSLQEPSREAPRPFLLLRFPIRAGDTWHEEWKADFAGPGAKITADYEVLGEEDVVVPAGAFHALRVRQKLVSPPGEGAVFGLEATVDRWFAKGVGVVRRVTTRTIISGAERETEEQTLDLVRTSP